MNTLIPFISQYGLTAIFTVILMEYACFPLSSEIVLPFSGAIASITNIPYILVVAVSVAAGLIGTSICYLIGWIGGSSILNTIKGKFPKTAKGIDSSCKRFESYGPYTVLIARVIPICRTYIGFVAGAAHLNYVTYITSSCIGISLWNSILIGLGYLFHDQWHIVVSYYAQYKDITVPLIVLVLLYLIAKVRKKARYSLTSGQNCNDMRSY